MGQFDSYGNNDSLTTMNFLPLLLSKKGKKEDGRKQELIKSIMRMSGVDEEPVNISASVPKKNSLIDSITSMFEEPNIETYTRSSSHPPGGLTGFGTNSTSPSKAKIRVNPNVSKDGETVVKPDNKDQDKEGAKSTSLLDDINSYLNSTDWKKTKLS